jgi:hypothetical protein
VLLLIGAGLIGALATAVPVIEVVIGAVDLRSVKKAEHRSAPSSRRSRVPPPVGAPHSRHSLQKTERQRSGSLFDPVQPVTSGSNRDVNSDTLPRDEVWCT